MVSKYLRETGRNLSHVFAEVKLSNAIPFFGEAAAWFRKGTQVNSSRNRYANMEIKYLFQKIEEYE